ncbi:hypothetical protein [Sulfurimonas autotrophica]|uniref:Uncharacterized protein n=1 Tax=Sulfurimonas autotrophica (strain ATCC BAA-671 / DSM 16294 / JCM 11897 / OK10) TaxID=563040 RepID=E0USC1_SULAO|nr:hypothetical protein [Sulfurimonas autotrophica]ADN09084.1 conserved hypothetical protein [Sulfurimonas autotrophica DSM 16294]
MRFTLIKNVKQDKGMKPLLNGLLIFIMLYLIFDIFVKNHTLGLSIHTVSTTLFGNADEFLDPMNKSVFLEFIHIQIFFLMMLLLTLSAVFIRLLYKKQNTILIMNLLMVFGILCPIALTAAYFYSAEFIGIYLVCFFSWHVIAFYMALKSLWELNFAE